MILTTYFSDMDHLLLPPGLQSGLVIDFGECSTNVVSRLREECLWGL